MSSKPAFTLFALVSLMFLTGCATDSSVKRLNEKEIAEQELIADQARSQFYCGQYDHIPSILNPLCQERTTSQPLYLCEMGTGYLACNDKVHAKECLLKAYQSIEGFFDPSSEKKAASLWGAEAEKVFKGEPYEKATLSLLTGLILLEEGDIDNALACFKNGQIADSDVEQERFRSDYGLLQILESKCYQLREDVEDHKLLENQAIASFAKTHPLVISKQNSILVELKQDKQMKEEDIFIQLDQKLQIVEQEVMQQSMKYYRPLQMPYNTLLLIWTGRAPALQRTGQYGEQRVFVKNPSSDCHFEVFIEDQGWFDVIQGFSNVSFQATTRGGREMDNVLANQASFKHSSHQIGNAFLDAADDTTDPYVALTMLSIGLVAHGVGAATNVKADIRCWKTLPEQLSVVPLLLPPGVHQVRVDCYNKSFFKQRTLTHKITVQPIPFQFYNIVVPTGTCPEKDNMEEKTVQNITAVSGL
jgi:hypothetical protein